MFKYGKGYKPAEANPNRFHSTSKFNIETGESLNKGKKDGKITLDDIKKANPHIKDLNKIKDTDFLVIPIPREMQDDADTVNMYFDPKTGECLF